MKLKNKKTGEKAEVEISYNSMLVTYEDGRIVNYYFDSLKDLEGWEDYHEELEKIYWVDCDGEIGHRTVDSPELDTKMRLLGNWFETKEQAERAVEKLKAWKRLKDKGFRFVGVRGIGKVIDFDMPKPYHHVAFDEYNANEDELEFFNDLMLLFGGEE